MSYLLSVPLMLTGLALDALLAVYDWYSPPESATEEPDPYDLWPL